MELLGEAVTTLGASSAQLEHARALVDFGAALRRLGQRGAVEEPLRRGLDIAHRCEALELEARAREELTLVGARPRRAAITGPAALTPSERRVAERAAAGLTNAEIALELFLSVKTVESHLGRAFRKLEVGSRAELPQALEDVGERPTTTAF